MESRRGGVHDRRDRGVRFAPRRRGHDGHVQLVGRARNVGRPGIDLEQISFIDSSGLRSLIRARQALGDGADSVKLRNPQPSTMRLLEITGLQDQFRLV